MHEAPEEFVLRRILVAFDASSGSLAALEAAAELAARTHAELTGLFVEDVNLLRLAGLDVPHLTLTGGQLLDTSALEAQLHALAAQARRALEQAAARRRIGTSFRVVRGSVTAEVVAASLEADLLILGWRGRRLWRREHVGGTAHAVAERSGGSVLLLPPGATLEHPVLALYDASPSAERALAVAARLARAAGKGLTVIVVAEDDTAARELVREAEVRLAGRGIPARYEPLVAPEPAQLGAFLRARPERLLVLAADSPILQRAGTREFLEEIGGPVLLAR